MTETGRFFDSVSYTESDQAEVQNRLRREGVLSEVAGLLAVSAPGSMNVSVAVGEAMVQGFWYKNTASLNLAIANNTSGSTRIDRVVLRLLRTANTISAVVVAGTPGAGLPAITQVAGGDWDYPLAVVTVPTGTTVAVTAAMLSDARTYSYQLSSADVLGEVTLNPAVGVRKELVIDTNTKLLYWAEAAHSGRNFLQNAMTRINQRGVATVTSNGSFIVDRWKNINVGTTGYTGGSTNSNLPTVAQAGTRASNSMYELSNGTVITSGMLSAIVHSIEGYDAENLWQQPTVLSWWSFATKVTTLAIALSNNSDRSFVHPYTHNVVGGVQYNWVAIPASPSSGTWTFGNAASMLLAFIGAAGSTYQTATPDTWNTGIAYATNTISNNLTVNGVDYFAISLPKLELGTVPTRFTSPEYSQDLDNCLRHLWMPATGTGSDAHGGTLYGTTQVNIDFELPVPMRALPSYFHSITNISTTVFAANSAAVEIERTQSQATGTFSSSSMWAGGYSHEVVRLISSVAYGSAVTGDRCLVFFGNGAAPGFTAEL